MFNKTYTLYEVGILRLSLHLSNGKEEVLDAALSNGRANYIIFEELIRRFTGLKETSGADHQDSSGKQYEQKSFKDKDSYPRSADLFQTSASCTFPANNLGPKIKALLQEEDYEAALEICKTTGYDKSDFYIYTNTGGFKPRSTLRYIILPRDEVLKNLDSKDPRMISRAAVLSLAKSKIVISERVG